MPDAANPYEAPATVATAPLAEKRDHLLSVKLLGGAALVFALCLVVARLGLTRDANLAWGFGASTLLALAGVVLGVRSAFVAKGGVAFGNAFAALLNLLFALAAGLVTLLSQTGFRRGRQLRRLGRVLLPRVVPGGSWTTLPVRLRSPLTDSAGALAAQWRENGRTEHASVAAFARLTLDLMALGAPPALVAAANRDALDEIRHTELCFSLARALDGRAEGPGPFPEASQARTLPSARPLALAKLAVDSLVDGALHEGVSARIVARLARRCEVPEIRDALKEIAADEGRHAAHGWDVVEWCVAEGGERVVHALLGATRALAETVRSPLPEEASDGGWERYGIHGHALEAEEYAKARAYVVGRVGELRRAGSRGRGGQIEPAAGASLVP